MPAARKVQAPKAPPPLLAPERIEKLLAIAMSRGADFAEVYAERTERTMASLEDQKIKSASYQTHSVYGLGHPLYYANVVDVMRGRAEPETDGREGLRSLELLIASYTSARDGRRVALPLEY